MDKLAAEDYKIELFDADAQQLLKMALKEPASVDLEKVASVIVEQSMKDLVFSKESGRICYTIVQAEHKQSGHSNFRRCVLNRLQQEFLLKEQVRETSVNAWVCLVTFICNVFDYLKMSFHCSSLLIPGKLSGEGTLGLISLDGGAMKRRNTAERTLEVNNMPMMALVNPVYDCLMRLAQPDALQNEEEVDCLVLQLHRIGEQLQKTSTQRMDDLFCLLRDGFLLQDRPSSLSRLLLLEVIEFRAGGWKMSESVQKYYYSEAVD